MMEQIIKNIKSKYPDEKIQEMTHEELMAEVQIEMAKQQSDDEP